MNQARWCALGVMLGVGLAAALGFVPGGREERLGDAHAHAKPWAWHPDKPTPTPSREDGTPQFVAQRDTGPPKAKLNLDKALITEAGDAVGQPDDGKLRIIAFGAHPDDCEIKTGGAGAMWAAQGHHVQFVSCTNGDIGHWQVAGGPLALRRLGETQRADRLLGAATEVMPIHDGELMPTLEYRQAVTRLIRRWNADIVLAHRPNDYHPDHRYTGVLVQDAAYMVAVPFFCPETPYLKRNPVFLYYWDDFKRPNAFRADVAVSIDEVIERKLDALGGMESQFFEGGATGYTDPAPSDTAGRAARHQQVRDGFRRRFAANADKYRDKLIELYGESAGKKVRHAEAFEVCEYGRQPSAADLKRMFPFFGK